MKHEVKVTLLTILFVGVSGWAVTSPDATLNQKDYELLDKLEAYGCANATSRMLRPQSYHSLRNALFIDDVDNCMAPPNLVAESKRFEQPSPSPHWYVGGFFVDSDRLALGGLETSVFPSRPYYGGRPFEDGGNLYSEVQLGGMAGGDIGISFSVTPGFSVGLRDYSDVFGHFYLQEVYGKIGYGRAELLLGRLPVKFGNAKHGSLLLSEAARPLDLVKFTLRPLGAVSKVGFFEALTTEFFVTGASESDFVQGTRFLSGALAFRVSDSIEVGTLSLFQFSGDGIGSVSFGDLNRMTVVGVSAWVPSHLAQVYGQFAFRELGSFSSWFSDDMNSLIGIWIPSLSSFDLRFEFVNTVLTAYQDSIYTQGLVYDKTPLGHPLGPDAQGIYFDIGFPLLSGIAPELSLFYERRGKQAILVPATENRFGATLSVIKTWGLWELSAAVQYARAQQLHYDPGVEGDLVAGWALLSYRLY